MFLLIVLPLVAVQGLHEILPLWRPEGAELEVGGWVGARRAHLLAHSDVPLLSLTSCPFLQGQVQTHAANIAHKQGLGEYMH